ncbi:MAG: hypothetical protein ACYTE3_11940 [Planctomycetota bacterium]|jgi:hypothetical protein
MGIEGENSLLWGGVAFLTTAVTGLYAMFAKHVFNHPSKADIQEDMKALGRGVEQLRDTTQSLAVCEEIVKRFDDNHTEVCQKLNHIIKKLEKGAVQ